MRVTQKDIARRLGLSPSLVSRALAGTADRIGVRAATVRRIEREAQALGYVPHAAARQLRGAGQPVLGVVAADLADPFFGPAVAEVIRQSHRAGYALSLAGFEQRQPSAADTQVLLQHDLAALLVLGGGPLAWVAPFVERGVTVIRIGRGETAPGVAEVRVNEAHAMGLVAKHLVELGHRDVAFVGADQDAHRGRLAALREALRRHRVAMPAARCILAHPDVMEAGQAGVARLAEHAKTWPTAMVCSSDAVALGVLRSVATCGMRVPEHVSVTGFDDLALAQLATPPLTTVRQPLAAMVADALRLVAKHDAVAGLTSEHEAQLVVRGSTTSPWNA